MRINVTRSAMPPIEEYMQEISSLWETRWLTNMGEKHRTLEQMLQAYFNAPNVTLFTNGHLALEGALAAFQLSGEVITTPFTFASTTHAVVRSGLTPVFCDIDPESYTIDPAKIERLITPRTSAIVPVHVYGSLCNVEAIDAIAKKHNLKVIYDAAHAFGVRKDGMSAACFGNASMFSFHATKVFHTVEGGAVVLNDPDPALRTKLNEWKNFGYNSGEVQEVGGNAKMSEFHAAMGICNLRRVDTWISMRKQIVERYRYNLTGIPGLTLMKEQRGVESNYSYLPVVFNGSKYSRDEAAERLAAQEIFTRKYFFPLTSSCAAYNFNVQETPVAKHISNHVLTLPLYPELAIEDVDRICEIISM